MASLAFKPKLLVRFDNVHVDIIKVEWYLVDGVDGDGKWINPQVASIPPVTLAGAMDKVREFRGFWGERAPEMVFWLDKNDPNRPITDKEAMDWVWAQAAKLAASVGKTLVVKG